MRVASYTPPSAEMIQAVDAALKDFLQVAPDPKTISQCPALPGIVLDRINGSVLTKDSAEYEVNTKEYNRVRMDYLKALVAHPVGRILALLAVGPDGVTMMELGQCPAPTTGVKAPAQGKARPQRDRFNCHHVIPKSIAVSSGPKAISHPRNFSIVNTTRRGPDQSSNPHFLWHSLILHPQVHNRDQAGPIYVVRPLFPFYPPITRGFRDARSLRKHLEELGAPPLPEAWENRILAFSQATNHQRYSVPREYQAITREYGDLFSREQRADPELNRRARDALAEKVEKLAAEFLPGDAVVNGELLGPQHKPKFSLPIIQSGLDEVPSLPYAELRPARRQTKPRSAISRRVQPKTVSQLT